MFLREFQMLQDVRGYQLDTSSSACVENFDKAVARFFEFRLDAVEYADAAISADPDCSMAQLLKGYMLMGAQSRNLLPVVAEHIAKAEAKSGGLTQRAKGWLAGLKALSANDLPHASKVLGQHMAEWPLDLFVLKQLHQQTLFWRGKSLDLRDSVLRVSHAWDKDVVGFGHYLGMLGFGYEEAGEYEKAEMCGRAALQHSPEDLWAVHTVAHVLEMQGRHKDGIEWINYPLNAWDDRAPLARHIWWHKALFLWDSGSYDETLALYDSAVYPAPSTAYIDVQNAAALLWRLEMTGVDVGSRWHALAGQAEATMDDQLLAFTESHVSAALAKAGRSEALAKQRQQLAERADGEGWAANLASEVSIPLADAFAAYTMGDYEKACDGLLASREEWVRVGGSHAQRDLYTQVLVDSAVKAGRRKLAESLLAERGVQHPNSAGLQYWRRQLAA
jgi:tetratricopeptide (TPR) repeat protein